MAGCLKGKVLQSFKNLHKARLAVFEGDLFALKAAREKINDEFKKNKDVKERDIIEDLIIYADTVAHELITTVVQAKEKTPGVYEAKVTPETVKLDNKMYDPNAKLPSRRKREDTKPPSCQDPT